MESVTQPAPPPPPDPPGGGAPATGPDLTGRTLSGFQILRRLGQGGMGQVYLAEQLSLKRKVALKILRDDVASSPTSLQRFKAEAEAVARATHANIVQVYEFGECAGQYYMALEYVEGRNLREYLTRKGPPDVPLALAIMRQVAAALQRASELGIIHRDIKPENILLTRKGEVKVADFGLSRVLAGDQPPLHITQSGVTMGTPLYMSPEQVEGRPVDARTDIYSFGVTCYHMLSGEPPYRGKSAFEVALQHVKGEPTPLGIIRPDLPAELCAVVHKMMAREPENRYQTCREVLKDLAIVRESLAVGASAQQTQLASMSVLRAAADSGFVARTVVLPQGKWRHRLPWAVALSLLLAAAVGALIGWYRGRHQTPPPPEPVAADAGAVEAMFSLQKREWFLTAGVEQYADPGNDPAKIREGIKFAVELGLLYLDDRLPRLDDAEQVFRKLIDNPHNVRAYGTVGRLGLAMVLAFRNQPEESDRLFLEVLDKKPDGKRLDGLMTNANFRHTILEALDYNAKNLAAQKQKLPQELAAFQRFLLNQTFPPKRPGAEKPSGKGS